jgi:hypothetical protein
MFPVLVCGTKKKSGNPGLETCAFYLIALILLVCCSVSANQKMFLFAPKLNRCEIMTLFRVSRSKPGLPDGIGIFKPKIQTWVTFGGH